MILNRAKNYDKNDKERLKEQARNKYRNLSEEDKNKKRKYRRKRYDNMSEEKKQKLKKYQKKKKKTVSLKSLNLIISIFYGFNSVSYDLVIHY